MAVKTIRFMGLGLLVLFLITGCLQSVFTYKGKIASEENRIPLKQDGPHTGTWKGDSVTVTYAYTKKQGAVSLSGEVIFDDHIYNSFRSISSFFLQVHFIDAEGKILEDHGLSAAAQGQNISDLMFEETLPLSSGAVAMVFSYRGRAEEGGGGARRLGGDDGMSWSFWESPLQ